MRISIMLFCLFLVGSVTAQVSIDDWKIVTASDTSFTLKMPAVPQEQVQKVPTPMGELETKVLMHQDVFNTEGNMIYGLIYTDYPISMMNAEMMDTTQLNQLFDQSKDGMIQQTGGELTAEAPVEYNGAPGRDYTMLLMNGTTEMNVRLLMVKNRLYILQTGAMKGKLNAEERDAFFATLDWK